MVKITFYLSNLTLQLDFYEEEHYLTHQDFI